MSSEIYYNRIVVYEGTLVDTVYVSHLNSLQVQVQDKEEAIVTLFYPCGTEEEGAKLTRIFNKKARWRFSCQGDIILASEAIVDSSSSSSSSSSKCILQ